MQIVVTALLDQLYDLLAQGPGLVTLYERKDAGFVTAFRTWLIDGEAVLEKHRRPQIAQIAAIRAQLLSGSSGVYDNTAFAFPAKGAGRKTYHASAAILFKNAVNVLTDIYLSYAARKEDAAKTVRQILLVALQKNLFYPVWTSGLDVSQKLNGLWQAFAVDKDLAQGARQVLSLVHYADALRLLGEAIDDLKL